MKTYKVTNPHGVTYTYSEGTVVVKPGANEFTGLHASEVQSMRDAGLTVESVADAAPVQLDAGTEGSEATDSDSDSDSDGDDPATEA